MKEGEWYAHGVAGARAHAMAKAMARDSLAAQSASAPHLVSRG